MRPTGEALIEQLASELDVPDSRYESAERSYKSVGSWLERQESRFSTVDFNVYTQGSFRLGTAIKPYEANEHYDLDVVCEFSISKAHITQKALADDFGEELKLYALRHNMEAPSSWDRCWTLNYADGAQFHMDVLPSVQDGQNQRRLRLEEALTLDYVDQSISITDKNHINYPFIDNEWPASNPNGYAKWFYGRMEQVFASQRHKMMLDEAKAEISEIPVFRVKTPLQSAIKLLKRHRDMRFADEPEKRPTSIVITTLAAQAYQQEDTITGALLSILERMDQFIERRGEDYWIANPSDPRENFADAWKKESSKHEHFYDWLETARADFAEAARQNNLTGFVDALAPRMGRKLVEDAVSRKYPLTRTQISVFDRATTAIKRLLDAPHRRPINWPMTSGGTVTIVSATTKLKHSHPKTLISDDTPVAINSELRFEAITDVQMPYRVYWQIVNTGAEAKADKKLRGGFDESKQGQDALVHIEVASYRGTHSIECFIVKNEYLVARSSPFIVNIA
ncbi:MAG: nucleotidyltransferase [Thalassospira sp.]|uniref:Cyclic GMP-AMP synthase n=1 Tax=Thalassospira xiamenensis TaxID=220697 RepID=A0ABR5XZQ0_9PROT|nr:hypothetical protein AUP40_02255 [Thalassospira xiamenensis]MAL28377.1 nucleotidyltransferase [Thalassospira sp.]QPL38184.1 nucleotidyltransferase [Thalassospira sp. B30-1]HIO02674.1 nucleotidyltransferase [Alphaproteobacteria bacterium]KZD11345.1 hypothetical protein AUP45_07850 [Thalassospira xiamenensis]